jgi:ABC-2 type transport system permease protein
MRAETLKWSQTIQIAWSKYTAYRLNFFLQIIGPALVFFFIKYNLWSSIYQGDQDVVIGNFNFEQMIQYHIWAMMVGLLAQGHTAMNLAEEIRLGKISTYLIYPFQFWQFHTAHFLAFQLLQLVVTAFSITLIVALGFMPMPELADLFWGVFYCMLVGFFWFSLQYFTGILGFWLEETWILRVILSIVVNFLSGAILPLDFYPESFVRFLDYTPFPYLTYYPIKVFMGEASGFLMASLFIVGWTFFICLLNSFTWRRGIKLYTAAGM